MQRFCFSSWMVACVAFMAFARSASAATLYPYLDPLRDEITTQIEFVSDTNNAVERRTALVRQLNQARNFLNRRGRATLQNDVRILATLSTLLTRNATLRPALEPVLLTAAQDYTTVMIQSADAVGETLNALPPSRDRDNALSTLDLLYRTLDDAQSTDDPGLAARHLNRAAIRLLALQRVSPRLDPGPAPAPVVNSLTAFINGENFTSDLPPSATFSRGTGVLSIRGSQTIGGETRSLSISISGVRDGRTSVHQLGDVGRGSYAIYTRSGTNTVGYTSTSGSAIVTIDPATGTVTGTFNFIGTSRAGLAAPLQVSGGEFTAALRR